MVWYRVVSVWKFKVEFIAGGNATEGFKGLRQVAGKRRIVIHVLGRVRVYGS